MDREMKSHWEGVYRNSSVEKLGWYEANPEPSLGLIRQCNLHKHASILNVGTGASTLVDELLNEGYANVIANDISNAALTELRLRLGPEESKKVHWIVEDLCDPKELKSLTKIDLWHDRAVLHFLQDNSSQNTYFNLLRSLLAAEAYVLIAAFNLNGAERCSGLPVFRYNADMLQERLGQEFHMKEAFDYTYLMPSGDTREYVYTLFQRKEL